MGKASPRKVVLDAGALIALERGNARMRALCREALRTGAELVIPAAVVAQVVRDRQRQVVLRAPIQIFDAASARSRQRGAESAAGGVHLDALRVRRDRGHTKSALRQSLVVENETVPVPYEDLHAVEPASEKNEEVAVERVQLPLVPHDRHEPVVPSPQVHRRRSEIHTDTRGAVNAAASAPPASVAE